MEVVDSSQYQIEELKGCPLCGTSGYRPFASVNEAISGVSSGTFEYSTCSSCELVYQRVRPTESTVGCFYSRNYEPYGQKQSRRTLLKPLTGMGMKAIDSYVGYTSAHRQIESTRRQAMRNGGCLVDFGCGKGAVLDSFKKSFDCTTIGMDFNTDVLAQVRSRGHRVLPSSQEGWRSIEDGSVDLLVMNHVIEHLYNPLDVLKEAYRVLRPGGVLDIATPNPNGLSAKSFGQFWFGLEAPRHIMLFPPKLAQSLVFQAGFSKADVVAEPVVKDFIRSQDIERRAKGQSPGRDAFASALFAATAIREASGRSEFDRYHIVAGR